MLDDAGVKILIEKKLPFVVTLDDLIALEKEDLEATGERNSRLRLAEQAFRKALAAGVPIVFGSGATSAVIPHGIGADQFKYYAQWGMTPSQAIRTAFLPAAEMLNHGWSNQVGSLEKGKFADIIAMSGNPLEDVTEMERVKFVMKGGVVMRDELTAAAGPSVTR
jgi:imidazolonepropionase-like amidohydrolase